MTTIAQVRRALKPLLEQRADLALVGRILVIKPIRHILRGVYIDRRSDLNRFEPLSVVLHLFEYRTWMPLMWPQSLVRGHDTVWQWSDSQAVPALLEAIDQAAIPQLQQIDSIEQLIETIDRNQFRHRLFESPPTELHFQIALGDLVAAERICIDHVSKWTKSIFGRDEDDWAKLRRLKQLCRLVAAGDRAGLAALLHEWEAQTVRNLKIDHLWEPTPFPLELPHPSKNPRP